MDETDTHNTGIPSQSYVIRTGMVPDKTYALTTTCNIRAIVGRFETTVLENNDTVPQTPEIMMALSRPDMFDIYRDLVVFHSFITHETLSTVNPVVSSESLTYRFAESTNKALYYDSEIETLDLVTSSQIGTDFDRFPVHVNVGMKPVFRYVNYRNAFSVFQRLKQKIGTKKIREQNKRLYDQINLLEFALNFDSSHRVYSNDYFPIALGMTILESIIGRPARCKQCEVCHECHMPMGHDKMTWSKYFRTKYVGQVSSKYIKIITGIRNETYHNGNFFDWFEEYDKTTDNGDDLNEKDANYLDEVESVQNTLLDICRRKVLHQFLRKCSPKK